MDQLSPAELHAWINDTYRARHVAFVRDVQDTSDAVLAAEFGVAVSLAQRLKAAVRPRT